MEQTTAVTIVATNVIDAILPFVPDDGHKGSFLVMRIAGMEQGTALRIINRKYRSLQNWRSTDSYFRDIDDVVPSLSQKFGGEARVVRTALLDISIIEAGIGIFKRILEKKTVSDGQWAYAVKMAGLRVPMMRSGEEGGNPWEKFANAVQQTMTQRDMVVREEVDGTKTTTAREIVVEPSAEQRLVSDGIVERMLQRAGMGEN